MDNPYQISDQATKLLNRKAILRFQRAKRDCHLMDIDELNVIKTINQLYKNLAADNQKAFLDLAVMAYQDAEPHGRKKPDKSWLLALLDSYDPVSLYVYSHEVERKRDYTIEGVISAQNKTKEFRRSLVYWSRMTAHETDRITDQSTLKAYRDAGVKKVRWRTEEDSRVCEVCEPRDKKVYSIDKVPPKPHLNCRCWLEAVL